MSREDVEQVIAGVDAFNRRDFATATAGFHPDVEWEAVTDLLPDAAVYRGPQGVLEFWRTVLETMNDFTLHVEEAIDAGEGRVFLMTRASGRGKDSGVPVEATFPHVYELRDRQVVRVRLFASRAAALGAVGLSA